MNIKLITILPVVKDLMQDFCYQYEYDKRTITLSYDRHEKDMVYTLVHEIGHLIQSYNIGAGWPHVYNHQLKLVDYTDNMFEVQARYMTILLKLFSEEYITIIVKTLAKI